MSLEEMLRQEREGTAPNPLIERTDDIVARVRRRRARAASAAVLSLVVLAVLAGVAGRFIPVGSDAAPIAPVPPAPTIPSEVMSLARVRDASPLEPGRYLVSVDGARSPSLLQPVLTVPEGYERIDGATGVRTADVERYVWVWDVQSVYPNPCQAGATYEAVGPSVADLANALAAQPLRTGTAAPVPVTVGGYDGLYLELAVPVDADLSTCPDGGYSLWPGRAQQEAGQVDPVWIVDVDGQRVVFDASYAPSTSPEQVAELKAMVTTATFTPGDST